jgi:hypothetical protein
LLDAVRPIKADERFVLPPIVVVVKTGDNLVLDQLATEDSRIGKVLQVGGDPTPEFVEAMMRERDRIARFYGAYELTPEDSLGLALAAAGVLGDNALSCAGVFNVMAAESGLIDALRHPSEALRVAAGQVLAKLQSQQAQQALAAVALGSEQTESLRLATFDSLAESARHWGTRLTPAQTDALMKQAMSEPNLKLRTAASQTLGAMNLPSDRAAEILLAQPQR